MSWRAGLRSEDSSLAFLVQSVRVLHHGGQHFSVVEKAKVKSLSSGSRQVQLIGL